MKAKLRMTALFLCLLMGLGSLAGCAGEVKDGDGTQAEVQGNPVEVPEPAAPEETPFVISDYAKYLKESETVDEAMERVMEVLEAKDIGYIWEVRDYFYLDGKKNDVKWLHAVNQYDEWLDVLISSNSFFLQTLSGNPNSVRRFRRNEAMNYSNAIQKPLDGTFMYGITSSFQNDKKTLTFYSSGMIYSLQDLMNDTGAEIYSADKKAYYTQKKRPEATPVPANVKNPPEGAVNYVPAETMEEEIAAMKKRLEDTGLGYRFEEKDAITVDGKEYPVRWIYAINAAGEYVDIVFSEDTDLPYLLHDQRRIFMGARSAEKTALDEKHPGRAAIPADSINNWSIVDVFYHGYGIYLNGCGYSMLDCGLSQGADEWSDELGSGTFYYSRDAVIGIQVVGP